jgi:Xaa-Pro aminopeptidase
MLADLDSLMRQRAVGAVIVPMHEAMHASFRWLTRGAKVTRGYAVKVVDRAPVLITYPMERDEAAATGLEVRLIHQLEPHAAAYGQFFDRVLRELGASGSVAFFGNAPLHIYLGIAAEMSRRGWPVFESNGVDLIQLARKRKDEYEIAAIRSVGERTEAVVEEVRKVLREGRRLKIGDLKELITVEITRRGMVEDHETIVSQGRDAGIPHSRGNAAADLVESVPLVIDIFPADRATGYFFDLTRTFCVGKIPDELRRIHAHVLEAHQRAADAMRPGTRAPSYQALVCDYFESHDFPTTRRNPATLEGYVHSLGHGVGLDIHEKPSFALSPSNDDTIEAGDVLTIEPGLYFPDRGIGVRIEDTFVVRADRVESLSRSDRGLEP